jgi:hypothetical protein
MERDREFLGGYRELREVVGRLEEMGERERWRRRRTTTKGKAVSDDVCEDAGWAVGE